MFEAYNQDVSRLQNTGPIGINIVFPTKDSLQGVKTAQEIPIIQRALLNQPVTKKAPDKEVPEETKVRISTLDKNYTNLADIPPVSRACSLYTAVHKSAEDIE